MKLYKSTVGILLLPTFLLSASKPNIVMILADDLGYGDLSSYGHPHARTPVIDQLAKDGVRFTQHYANGTECSPTRTAFLTGRYQQRVGGLECAIGTGNIGRYDDAARLAKARDLGLPADQSVLPGGLKERGYKCGIIGKWHLGYEPHFNPMVYGWDDFFGYMGGNVHYFNHRETSSLHVLYDGNLPVHAEGYMSDLITERSIRFIKANKDNPFFLYIAHESPHFPFQGPGDKEKVVDASNWNTPDEPTYVAMLEDLDAQVGKVLIALENEGLTRDTIVVFVSDNGGYGKIANMGPLNGAKSTTLEGGIRVPMVIRWPGRITPGKTCNQTCVTFDLTYSFLGVAGADTSFLDLDGMDIIDHVVSGKRDFHRNLFWRGKRGERVWSAVRSGDMKYVRKQDNGKIEEWVYDLSKDIGEKEDLAASKTEILKGLKDLLSKWECDVKPIR